MSKELKIIPKVNAKTNQKFDETVGCLILEKSENFSFTIEESDTFAPDKPKSLKPFSLGVSDVDYDRMTKYNQQVQNKEIKSYNKKAEAHKAEMASFDKKMKPKRDTVSWAWQVVGNGIKPHNITHNQSFSKGIDANTLYNFTFPKVLEGGGMAWLEVFTDTDPATGKIPYGMFVQAKGEPKIIRIEWTDQDYNPIPESTMVAFDSQLILHIYTSGMYGQDVEVNLFDKDVFSGDDPLNISKKEAFTREVVLKEVKPHEKGKYGVSGFLVSSNQSKAKGTVEGATVVQKIEIKVSIQSDWKTDAGGNLWIYPSVKALETGKVFDNIDRQKLHVHKNGISFDVPAIPTNNTPLMVGQVETNVAHFNHCRYDSIKLSEKGKAPIVVFDSNRSEDRIKKEINIDVIAGKKATNYIDFELKTEECVRKHLEHEILITAIPNSYVAEVIAGGRVENKIVEEQKELYKASSESKFSILGFSSSNKEAVKKETGKIKLRKGQLEFDAFYNYDIPDNKQADPLTIYEKALQYFWLPDLGNKIQQIKLKASSCAFDKNVIVAIYPDIKWTLKFGFNVTKEDIEALNRKGENVPLKFFETIDEDFKKKSEATKITETKGNKRLKGTLERANEYFEKEYKLPNNPVETTIVPPVETRGKSFSKMLELLMRVSISLSETHYGGDEKNELSTESIKKFFDSMSGVLDLTKKAIEIIEGKHDEKPFTAEDKIGIDGLMKKLNRSTTEYEILYPKLAFAGSWFYEQIDANKYPELAGRQGLGIDIQFNAAPLLGVTITWDLLELLCRKNPIAYAILKAVQGLIALLLDDPSCVKLDFIVTGQIDATMDLQHNMLAGFKDFKAKGKQSVQVELKLELKIQKSIKYGNFEVLTKLGFGAGSSIGLGIEDAYGIDSTGFYIQKDLIFEGVKFNFEVEASGELMKKSKQRKSSILKIGGNIKGEITMLAHTFSTDKIYLIG